MVRSGDEATAAVRAGACAGGDASGAAAGGAAGVVTGGVIGAGSSLGGGFAAERGNDDCAVAADGCGFGVLSAVVDEDAVATGFTLASADGDAPCAPTEAAPPGACFDRTGCDATTANASPGTTTAGTALSYAGRAGSCTARTTASAPAATAASGSNAAARCRMIRGIAAIVPRGRAAPRPWNGGSWPPERVSFGGSSAAEIPPTGVGSPLLVALPQPSSRARRPGIGIVGCGRAAVELHLPAISRLPHIDAVAATDHDAAVLARIGGRFGVRTYAGLEDLLADPAVTIVIVSTPPASHAEVALTAVAAGKHVLVEKPLTLDPAEAEHLVQAGAGASVVTAIGFNLRCHRLVEAARELIGSGTLGSVSTLRTTWTAGRDLGRPLPPWRTRREDGGGVLYEVATHHVDLWRYLLGEEVSAIAATCRSGDEEDEAAVLTGRADGGALLSSVISDNAPDANEVDIVGSNGRLRFSLYRGDSLELSTREPDYSISSRIRALGRRAAVLPAAVRAARSGGDFVSSYARQLERLVAATQGVGQPAATWADGLAAVRLVHAAVESTGP
jgi:myo-inositol 2-dehydrogenase/D-chiro-inositol 1-dehydrogenase